MNTALVFSRRSSLVVLAVSLLLVFIGFTQEVYAQNKKEICRGANLTFNNDPAPNKPINCATNAAGDAENSTTSVNNLVSAIVNIFSIIVGIVAVIMIIVGGLKFITSGGDSAKVTSARNAIVYAIIGLVVVALAQFIVKFVLKKATDAA